LAVLSGEVGKLVSNQAGVEGQPGLLRITLLSDKSQVLCLIFHGDLVENAPVLFLHRVQNGGRFKIRHK
jgi:hypothetical protein